MALFLKWGRGELRKGLFFIIELHLVLFGESDLNPVTGRHSHGSLFGVGEERGLRIGLFFIVELHLVLFGESDLNPATGRHSHGPLFLECGGAS